MRFVTNVELLILKNINSNYSGVTVATVCVPSMVLISTQQGLNLLYTHIKSKKKVVNLLIY